MRVEVVCVGCLDDSVKADDLSDMVKNCLEDDEDKCDVCRGCLCMGFKDGDDEVECNAIGVRKVKLVSVNVECE